MMMHKLWMIKQVGVSISLLLGSCAPAYTQQLKQALQNMRQAYEKSSACHVVMQVKAFDGPEAPEAYYTETAHICRRGTDYHYRFGNQEMLMNKKYLVVVDKGAQQIVLNKRHLKAEAANLAAPVGIDLDSILNFYDTPEYLGRHEGVDHYKIVQKQGPIGRIDLMLQTDTHLLQALHYHYRTGEFVTITFLQFNLQPDFTAATFDEQQYVTRVRGKLQGVQAFRAYTIIDEPETTYR